MAAKKARMGFQTKIAKREALKLIRIVEKYNHTAGTREVQYRALIKMLCEQMGELKDVIVKLVDDPSLVGRRLVDATLDGNDVLCVHEATARGGHRDRVTLVCGSGDHPQPVREMGDDIPPADWNY